MENFEDNHGGNTLRLFGKLQKRYFHRMWKEARFLVINMVYTSFPQFAKRFKISGIGKLGNIGEMLNLHKMIA